MSCKSNVNSYGSGIKLVGEHLSVFNGWHYKVWGASDDPTTWLEQNITLLE
jgi:hypothetical protein